MSAFPDLYDGSLYLTPPDRLLQTMMKMTGQIDAASLPNFNKEISVFSKALETSLIIRGSAPMIFTLLMQYSLGLVNVYFIKSLGEKELNAASLSITVYYITGIAIFNGFSTCLDTLCGQSYGTRNFKKIGTYCQQAAIILTVLLIPLSIFHYNSSELILNVILKIDKREIYLSKLYLRIMILGSPGLVLFEVGKRFVQCQGIFLPQTIIMGIMLAQTILLNSFLIPKFGFIASPLICVLSYWMMACYIITYIYYTSNRANPRKCWGGLTLLNILMSDIRGLLFLALHGIFVILSEALAFQILTFMACLLTPKELSAQAIVSLVANGLFQIPFGVSTYCCTRIANLIGARENKHLPKITRLYLTISVIMGIALSISMFGLKSVIAKILSPGSNTKLEVEELITKCLEILAFSQVIDCINIMCAGILRGQGMQKLGSQMSIFSLYFLGVPIIYLLTFTLKNGIFGLWIGMGISLTILASLELFVILDTDWVRLIDSLSRRELILLLLPSEEQIIF